MISAIHIKNFNIIESVQIHFHQGFHVISGETGAGKSILLQAIAFSLGVKTDSETIRAGADEASVTLILEPSQSSKLTALSQDLGLNLLADDGLLYLRRTLHKNGRSRGFVNDEAVTMKTLQTLGQAFIHLVGQHAARQLLEEKFLLGLLDRFAAHQDLLSSYGQAYSQYHEVRAELEALNSRIQSSREQEDFLRFQYEELDKAKPCVGEEEELEARKNRLKHRVALQNQTFEMHLALSESQDSISDRLGRVLTLAEKTRSLDESLGNVVTALEEAALAVDSAARHLTAYSGHLEEDPEELDQVEDRLALLTELKRKYRTDEKGLIAKRDELSLKVGELENFDELLQERQRALTDSTQKLQELGTSLHAKRKTAGKKLSAQLEKVLKDLALPHAKVSIVLELQDSVENYASTGADALTFDVSFNPGEELRSLAEVVSGGELSRLLLAMYEILFPPDQFGVLIFDEVDTGVGGKVAELIGRKLETLSTKAQVLCVTHLPQIACHAAWHYAAGKEVRQGRTYSEVRLLKKEERVLEIARMLAGVEVTEQALKHAKELLKNAAA